MAWEAQVTRDADKANVGTATLIWNVGEPGAFTYSRRVRLDVAGEKAFIEDAITARDAQIAKTAAGATLALKLAAAANVAQAAIDAKE